MQNVESYQPQYANSERILQLRDGPVLQGADSGSQMIAKIHIHWLAASTLSLARARFAAHKLFTAIATARTPITASPPRSSLEKSSRDTPTASTANRSPKAR